MTDPGARRYDDDEIGRILSRATELQEEKSETPAVTGGLTADELVGIASDVGIDHALVRRAIRELDVPEAPSSAAAAFMGAPPTIRFERVVAGEVEPGAFERMQLRIEEAAQHPGQGSLIGTSLRWQSGAANATGWLRVHVTSHDGETRILIEENLQNLAGSLFGGIMGGMGGGVGLGVGMGVGLGALGSPLFALVFSVGVISGSYLLARGIFTSVGRRRRGVLEQLDEDLAGYPRLGGDQPEVRSLKP